MALSPYERGYADGCRERARVYVTAYEAGVKDVKERLRAVLEEDFRPGGITVDEEDRHPIEGKPLSMLDLEVRTHNALARCGIRTIGDLLLWDERRLLEAEHIGPTRLAEVRAALAEFGLVLS